MDSQEVILRVIQGKGSPVVQWLRSSADAAEDDGDLLVLLANNIYHPRTQMEEIAGKVVNFLSHSFFCNSIPVRDAPSERKRGAQE